MGWFPLLASSSLLALISLLMEFFCLASRSFLLLFANRIPHALHSLHQHVRSGTRSRTISDHYLWQVMILTLRVHKALGATRAFQLSCTSRKLGAFCRSSFFRVCACVGSGRQEEYLAFRPLAAISSY